MLSPIAEAHMQQTDLSTLKKRISEVAKKSAVAGGVTDVVLEADKDAEGGDFLRVILKIKSLERVPRKDSAALTESIEDAVGDVDERFPSVRFAEAA
jgi:hypothetical protein